MTRWLAEGQILVLVLLPLYRSWETYRNAAWSFFLPKMQMVIYQVAKKLGTIVTRADILLLIDVRLCRTYIKQFCNTERYSINSRMSKGKENNPEPWCKVP
ncbi:hypothetical protein OROMI_021061 [Orobanche minor]